jgi:hypothetical protein
MIYLACLLLGAILALGGVYAYLRTQLICMRPK